jgi:hypothetical protein
MTISPVTADAGGSSGRPAAVGGHGSSAAPVCIQLSKAQVNHVVRAADGGSMLLLAGLEDVQGMLVARPEQLEDPRLSGSLLRGMLMLASFPTDRSYLGIAEIARMLDMEPSTVHRYISTLFAVGLLERDPATRRYRLAR